MDSILHVIGICGDNHSHFDLIDLIVVLGGGGAGAVTVKLYYRTVIYMVKDYFNVGKKD